MSKIAFLGNFNNYFNRQIKYKPQYSLYNGYGNVNLKEVMTDINFNPNDGIATELVVNWTPTTWTPDYMLVLDDSAIYDQDTDPVLSRWFVVEFLRLRNGQYNATLKRDVVCDNYDRVLEAPTYIEKATLSAQNPLIYNSEGMIFNQIKQQEILLKDNTEMPWIVGYCVQDSKRYPQVGSEYKAKLGFPDTVIKKSTLPSDIRNILFNESSTKIAKRPNNSDYIDVSFLTTQTNGLVNESHKIDFHFYYKPNMKILDNYTDFQEIQTDNVDFDYRFLETDFTSLYYFNSNSEAAFLNKLLYTNENSFFDKYASVKSPINALINTYLGLQSASLIDQLIRYNGMTIYDDDTDEYYNFYLEFKNLDDNVKIYPTNDNTNLNSIRNLLNFPFVGSNLAEYYNQTPVEGQILFEFHVPYYEVSIRKTAVNNAEVSVHIPAERRQLNRQPFDMFAIPYGNLKIYNRATGTTMTTSADWGLAAARALAQAGMGNVVYDIQLLPYCPVKDIVNTDVVYPILLTPERDYTAIFDDQVALRGLIFWGSSSEFTFNIDTKLSLDRKTGSSSSVQHSDITKTFNNKTVQNGTVFVSFVSQAAGKKIISVEDDGSSLVSASNPNITDVNIGTISFDSATSTVYIPVSGNNVDPTDETISLVVNFRIKLVEETIVEATDYINPLNVDTKLSNECDLYRLCSPNFASMYDFSVAKNGGVDFFNVDCSYKPFNPYIHINPAFNGLYGQDFNDPRGLILAGDFSISTISNAFSQYELQNKNYRLIFDREIQHMDTDYKIKQSKEAAKAINNAMTSVETGTVGGAIAGSKVGATKEGAMAGAAIGGVRAVGQLRGAAIDIAANSAEHQEAKSFATDMFNYNLGNIQALPNSLTSVSALNFNNKLFPLIEIYTCTDEEKQAFLDKLKWNGMTVMKIGTIGEFVQPSESFIKGQVIRLTGLNDDSHIANEIYKEINKGIYI